MSRKRADSDRQAGHGVTFSLATLLLIVAISAVVTALWLAPLHEERQGIQGDWPHLDFQELEFETLPEP